MSSGEADEVMVLDDGPMAPPEDDAMEIDDADEPASPGSAKAQNADVRAAISKVLQFKDFHSLRSAKLCQDDFLLLLSKFNEEGFHFS